MTTPRKNPAKATPRKRAPRKATPKTEPTSITGFVSGSPLTYGSPLLEGTVHSNPPPPTEEQKQAKLHAYSACKSAGVEPPFELAQQVEAWIKEEEDRRAVEEAARSAQRTEVEKVNNEGPWFVLNGYHAPFSLRLERHDKKKRIELKPRGQRGDMHPLQEEDLKDSILIENLNIGLISLIPAGEAQLRSEQQVTNVRQPHTPLAILRNEKGESYSPGAFKVEAEFNSQGVTVAYLDPEVAQGKKQAPKSSPMGDIARPVDGQNPYQQVSHFVPTGGNPAIISSGFAGDQQKAKVADDIARRKGTEGLGAGLPQGITVSVDPVQKT